MNILNLNPVVNRSFLAYSYDPKTPFATLDLYLYVNLLKGGLHVFYGHMAAVQLLGTVMTIPRRCVLPCPQKTAHSTPSNCWISVETFESLNKSLWGGECLFADIPGYYTGNSVFARFTHHCGILH
jgi:hypothetical protein